MSERAGHGNVVAARADETVLVQCKHWKAFKVDVRAARELLGVVTSRRATRGIVVTSGRFTKAAIAFARSCRQIELIDGPPLAAMILSIQVPTAVGVTTAVPPAPPAPVAVTSPKCPACGSGMAVRTARKGANAGSHFWGCTRFPACRGKRPLDPA